MATINTNDVFELLDTAAGDTGATYNLLNRAIKEGQNSYVNVEIGSGDTVVVEAKLVSTNSFVTIATFTATSLIHVDFAGKFRARRTVDGGTGDTTVHVQFVEKVEIV